METYEPGKEPVSSDKKFEALVGEADGFYRTIVTVSTAMMGGTLIFLDRVAKHPTWTSIIVLGVGWIFLFAAIGAILYVRRQNLESLRQALRSEYPKASAIDARTRRASSWAPWLMIVGMALVGLSGLMNLWPETGGGDVGKTSKSQRTPVSIAGGDSGSKSPHPAPGPTSSPPTSSSDTNKPAQKGGTSTP